MSVLSGSIFVSRHHSYDIQQEGRPHDPREDAVAALRLYRWVISQARAKKALGRDVR